jgi:hypothetical protein
MGIGGDPLGEVGRRCFPSHRLCRKPLATSAQLGPKR